MKALNVSLTDELRRFVEQKVETGLYQMASEVVREALRMLKQHDDQRPLGRKPKLGR